MKRNLSLSVPCLVSLGLAGCASVVGTWQREPWPTGQVKFPIDVVTLDEAGSFTASGPEVDGMHTWTGTYTWNHRLLTLVPLHDSPKTFVGRLASNDTLTLSSDRRKNSPKEVFHRLSQR